MDTESYDTIKSRPHCWTFKDCRLFPLQPSHQCRNTDYRRFPPGDQDNGRGEMGVLQVPNFPKNLRFRIAEGLLYYNEIDCNWKLIFECWVCFVACRVKINFYGVGVSGCVSVSHWIREGDGKSYKNYLSVNSYVITVCTKLLSEHTVTSLSQYKYRNTHHSVTLISW
jgi:hypothetical protein